MFRTLVVDPPWKYKDKLQMGVKRDGTPQKGHRGADSHYPTLTLEHIKRVPIDEWAEEDAHLYLWVTNAFMKEAFELVEHWKFKQRTILTWVKPHFGMGHYYRNATEHVLFCVRGRLPTNRRDIPTWFIAPRTKHSRKPSEFYTIVENMSPGAYLDVFARDVRAGWSSWGNEVESFDGSKGLTL